MASHSVAGTVCAVLISRTARRLGRTSVVRSPLNGWRRRCTPASRGAVADLASADRSHCDDRLASMDRRAPADTKRAVHCRAHPRGPSNPPCRVGPAHSASRWHSALRGHSALRHGVRPAAPFPAHCFCADGYATAHPAHAAALGGALCMRLVFPPPQQLTLNEAAFKIHLT